MRTWRSASAALCLLAGGCIGGNTNPSPSNNPTPQPTAIVTPPSGTTIATVTAGAVPATASIPQNTAGISATVAVPATSAGQGNVTLALSATPQFGVTLQSLGRSSIGATAVAYLTLDAGVGMTLSAFPQISITLPNAPSATPYLGFYDAGHASNGFVPAVGGPGTVGGTTVAFTPVAVPLVLNSGVPVVFALYASSTGMPVVTANAPNASFLATGAANSQTVSISEAGYDGVFSVSTTTCSPIVTVDRTTGRAFSLTPVSVGACTYTFTDPVGHAATLPVTVTQTVGGGV
jgi:hypothetical protein